ncbi:cation:proton antiporter [Natronosalvus halobius]|uniref:cation:proton antiporter n=1 Tax=Natronosalvus halobius TaxID=2953746 RepID=UPI00209E6F09|nr:cation:proton antiporter [Natronosalvus halobius]USZ72608.1 cation:proton antiporter [Natronosalvus halobius]
MSAYEIALIVVAFAIVGAVLLPRFLTDKPLSLPMIYVGFGAVLFWIVPGLPTLDPVANSGVTERLTELVVILALMGAGLKIDRPFDVLRWGSTWRLLAITMPVSIALLTVLGWYVAGLLVPTAILLGAVLAPTDPVLASDVEAGAPLTELEEERSDEHEWGSVRFSLTSEAGLNDGLAFPFTYLAIAAASASMAGYGWLVDWFLVDVLYRIGAGVVVGYVVGHVMARVVFYAPSLSRREEVMAGAEALAATLFAYGLAELLGGYGFIAVFVAALELRRFEWEHDYYQHLHDFAAIVERLLMATVLVLFGGAIAGGLLAPLTWDGAVLGLVFLFVIRPFAGGIAFLGSDAPTADRAVISFFGIRGIGSFYYLSFALAHASFEELELLIAAEWLWAFVGFVVLVSVFVHGFTASPVMRAVDERRPVDGLR